MKNNNSHQFTKIFVAGFVALPLCLAALSGCGGKDATQPTVTTANPQAADDAAKQAISSDVASAQSKAAAEARGKQSAQQAGQAAK